MAQWFAFSREAGEVGHAKSPHLSIPGKSFKIFEKYQHVGLTLAYVQPLFPRAWQSSSQLVDFP